MRNALVIALFGAALCGAILPAPAGAQVAPGVAAEAQPSPTASAAVVRTIRGIIYTPLGASDVRPAGNTWVTLHRVATDTRRNRFGPHRPGRPLRPALPPCRL